MQLSAFVCPSLHSPHMKHQVVPCKQKNMGMVWVEQVISNELILKCQGVVRTWEMTSKGSVAHGCNAICQLSEIIAARWPRVAGFTFPPHLWLNAWKKSQKAEVMWWDCPWEAAGVTVTAHTVAAMRAKAREVVCPGKTSVSWFVFCFCHSPIAASSDSPWMWERDHSPFLLSLELKPPSQAGVCSPVPRQGPASSGHSQCLQLVWGGGTRPLCQSHSLIMFAGSMVSSPELHPGRSRVPTFSNVTHSSHNFYPSLFHQAIQRQQMNRIVHTNGLLYTEIQGEEHFLSSPCHTA